MKLKWEYRVVKDDYSDLRLTLDGRHAGLVTPAYEPDGEPADRWATYTDLDDAFDGEIDGSSYPTMRKAMRALRTYTQVKYLGMTDEERETWREKCKVL
jgi:hypothetical protein